MASALAAAHIEGERRLRAATVRALTAIWSGLPGYDRANLDQWLSEVLPILEAGQRQSVNLTNAYLARSLERQPLPLDTGELLGAGVRNGTTPAEVYERPFVTLWGGLADGLRYEDALSKALARGQGMAAWDVQASMRAAANAVQDRSEGIYGFQRVADPGACQFCTEVDGAYVKRADAMPLHNHCGCGLKALTEPHKLARLLPDGTPADPAERERLGYPATPGVAIQQHGEMGPVLTAAGDHFTSESELH